MKRGETGTLQRDVLQTFCNLSLIVLSIDCMGPGGEGVGAYDCTDIMTVCVELTSSSSGLLLAFLRASKLDMILFRISSSGDTVGTASAPPPPLATPLLSTEVVLERLVAELRGERSSVMDASDIFSSRDVLPE